MQLLGPSKEAARRGERFHYADIVTALQRQGGALREDLRRLAAPAGRRGSRSGRSTARAEAKGASLGLELMDESRVEVDIEISRAMQLIDSTAEWELRELQTFTSTLVGQNHVSAESNPFRPLVYATALWDAACAVVASQAQRAIVLRTSAGVAAGLLKNAAAAASTRLESQGVEPGVYRTVVLPSGLELRPSGRRAAAPGALAGCSPACRTRPRRTGRRRRRTDGAVERRCQRRPMPSQRRRRAAKPRARAGADAPRRAASPPSPRDLALGKGRRRAARRAAPLGGARERERAGRSQVIELVTRLFESLLADSSLPGAFGP